MSRRPGYIAAVDSSTSMLVALARYLEGRDFPMLGMPGWLEHLTPLLNHLSPGARERFYVLAARIAARSPESLSGVRAERISDWMAGLYPRRRYPVVAIGSPNGAAVHLLAALGGPWLPQTFLVPVRQQGGHPDDVRRRAEAAVPGARLLLAANPELQVHQLHDPVNDRPQLHVIDYFRVKRLTVGPTYAQFLTDALEPGGTVLLVECRRLWPTTLLGERHVFQMGGVGGVTYEEYFSGGERVTRFLERHRSHRRAWEPPTPDGERPEAEWGLEQALRDDVERLARARGWRVVRLAFRGPEDLSPLVAELYRRWYRARGLAVERLLVECFFLLEPWWALRTGSVPYWMVMNSSPSIDRVHEYLDRTEPFEDIRMMLLSNAVDAIGNITVDQCRTVFERALRVGRFVGVDPKRYPRDLAALARYHSALETTIDTRVPMPERLTMTELEAFLGESGDRFAVEWLE